MKRIDRRELLAGCAAVALLAALPTALAAEETLDLDSFLKLSQSVTDKEDLDPDLAERFLTAFRAEGKGGALAAAIEGGDRDGAGSIERDLVAAWYTGLVSGEEGTRLVTYQDALIWRALPFTKPAGLCGGPMGYWADPPEV